MDGYYSIMKTVTNPAATNAADFYCPKCHNQITDLILIGPGTFILIPCGHHGLPQEKTT
jgi:hypothetical protein